MDHSHFLELLTHIMVHVPCKSSSTFPIIRGFTSNSEIIFKPLPKNDPTRRKPDITKARNLLAWKPETDFSTGLEKTIEWFRGELKK